MGNWYWNDHHILNLLISHRCPCCVSRKAKGMISIFVFSRIIISWLWLMERSIRFRLQGEGVLVSPLFFPVTLKLLYGMLVEMGLYRGPRRLKVWRWLCLPDLQFSTSYCDFLHAQRFCANFPALLFDLRWFLDFLIWGSEIHWGIIFNVDWQTWTINVTKSVNSYFTSLLQFHNQIIRSEMSLNNKSRM